MPLQEKWYELRMMGSDTLIDLIRRGAIREACEVLYKFKREVLLPIIEKQNIQISWFWMNSQIKTDSYYLEQTLMREPLKQIKRDIEKMMQQSLFKQFLRM